ncbi:MAG: GNAT family N-acetyltransferase [Opitutae bacterium]|jgi:ribosomal protein S18 acetylase RimI-like enzyme|nr:GNAT family N-acetyltransferase [Opitutae bacterium]MBT5717607.1 GNAT family N-acetyltransferase [Opitutae bacterium]
MIEISEIHEADEVILSSVNHLLPQLSKSAKPMDEIQLKRLAESECTRLYFAKEGAEVLGMLSLVVFPIPTGIKAWIEDVVVDERARGKGVGKALMNKALEEARNLGTKSIDLTSRPSRESANKLYQAIGYQERETNVYRYRIS